MTIFGKPGSENEPINQAPKARNAKAWGTAPGTHRVIYKALKARHYEEKHDGCEKLFRAFSAD
jgi:hypothetical protein